jgi:hypothetical protein
MDSDTAGRAAATRIADGLRHLADTHIVDLAPGRTDGYDLTDWLLAHPRLAGEAVGRQLLSCRCGLPQRDAAGITSPTRPGEPSSLDGSSG